MRKWSRITPALVATLAIAACATLKPTRYQPLFKSNGDMQMTGGFYDAKVGENRYQVAFLANGHTQSLTAHNYFLYRCAEVTKANGFDYFEILHGTDATSQQGAVIPFIGGSWANKPAFVAEIRLHHGTAPADADNIYDADLLMQNFGSMIQRAGIP